MKYEHLEEKVGFEKLTFPHFQSDFLNQANQPIHRKIVQ